MSDESLDELISLYRRIARETPDPRVDRRILAHAENPRRTWRWPLATAIAAGLLIWLGTHRPAPAPPPSVATAIGEATPGYTEGRTRAYLQSMDIQPPPSSDVQYLPASLPPTR